MPRSRNVNLGKAAIYAIVINAIQIALVSAFVLYSILGPAPLPRLSQAVVTVMGLVTCWGAVVDIREAISARQVEREADMLEEANRRMDDLNLTLRAQRHDFMNHLQVVYGLMEMDEKQAAIEYLDDVYKDLQRVGRTLKTAVPAVNALLAAKMADCEGRGIRMEMDIRSSWEGLPVEGWEICRALGNLIDNAMDALKSTPSPVLSVSLGENLKQFTFEVANNGPRIPPELQKSIFEKGFSTKALGRGMGLSIVEEILSSHGGELALSSTAQRTSFSGSVPKPLSPER